MPIFVRFVYVRSTPGMSAVLRGMPFYTRHGVGGKVPVTGRLTEY